MATKPRRRQGERFAKLKRETARLDEENHALRKRAETDGSLFDLKKDSAKDIASVIARSVNWNKVKAIHKALGEEINNAKHAG